MVDVDMLKLEQAIKVALQNKGIECQSVYRMPDIHNHRILLAIKSNGGKRVTTKKVKNILNSLGYGQFEVPSKFQRLSAAFLHLEVKFGARTNPSISPSAQ
ncbi:MAG: hypothetical protein PVG65_01390 [Candidatus Thorarchaeota archaeon]|jgi:hypothetical protein